MKSKVKLVAGNIIITLLLLVVVEAVCSTFNKHGYKDIGFLINLSLLKEVSPDWGFNEVDPLLGYAKTKDCLNAKGIKVENNCAVLTTTDDTAGRINILITGGSTTDLSLDENNWPVEFCKLLKAHGVKAKLHVAAVGGYNTGQELLKVIRDGVETAPFIHLSYSGANDINGTQSYVSFYEQMFYEHAFNQGATSWLLPNTIFFFRNLLHLNYADVHLHPNLSLPAAQYWEKNMRLMHGVATENKYVFLGMLQPVLGSGKFDQQIAVYQQQIDRYKKDYPAVQKVIVKHPDFLVDLTAIFDTCHGNVFKDNCHINSAYQSIVAANIYSVLEQKQLLSK